MLISAPLIVRNEEGFLERCLTSVKDVVDEIVVVDTGSTDRTKDIARAHNAHVYDFRWINDFAAARNYALGLARGDWILYIDADEALRQPCPFSELRQRLTDPSHVAYYVLLHPRPGLTAYPELRIFRNDPLIRFCGRIHENIWPGINRYRSERGGKIGSSGLIFDHEGYEGDQHHKHFRNLPLLRKALREDPDRIFGWCHLASIYHALGKDRVAKKSWTRALRLVANKGTFGAEDSLPYLGLAQFGWSRGHNIQGLLSDALNRFPGNLHFYWLRGKTLMASGRYAEAIPVFEDLLSRGETGDYDHSVSYDARILTVIPLACLATCHFKRGNYQRSRYYFELAGQFDPGNLEYRVKRELCLRLAHLPTEPGVTSRDFAGDVL